MPHKPYRLKPLELGDKELFEGFGDYFPRGLCEFSFANLIIWRDFDRPAFGIFNDNLCIRIEPSNERPFFLEPVGTHDSKKAVDVCMSLTSRLSRISAGFVAALDLSAFKMQSLRDHFDYIYETSGLAELSGRKYDGKRNHIRRFEASQGGYDYVAICRGHAGKALAIFDEWCAYKRVRDNGNGLPDPAFDCQRLALSRAFESFDELSLLGGALIQHGKMIGFVVGSRLHDDMACLHFSYTRPNIPGAYEVLLRDACQKTFGRFKFVNLEQDLGLLGLRKAKTSYHPVELREKFDIKAIWNK